MTKSPRRIPTYVVLPARTLLLDVAGPLEALRYANKFSQRSTSTSAISARCPS